MNREFKTWLSQFRESISDYGYYVDYAKVHRNVEAVKPELALLESLLGAADIEADFEKLLQAHPEVLRCVPLLLAIRGTTVRAMDADGEFLYDFKKPNQTAAQYRTFMRKTGLFDLLQRRITGSLVDYVTGIETGLDSNGRKNRGGHLMEDLVEGFIVKAGFVKGKSYFKEAYLSDIEKRFGLDLSALSNQGKAVKRFDFVVKGEAAVYGIETNFYGGGGSKLNETARSYKTLALEAAEIPGFEFVWFTDGFGWQSARHNLEETFDVMEHLYSIADLEDGIIGRAFR